MEGRNFMIAAMESFRKRERLQRKRTMVGLSQCVSNALLSGDSFAALRFCWALFHARVLRLKWGFSLGQVVTCLIR